MNLAELCQNLPAELQNKIYHQSFEGSANRIFKEFIKENELFRYNWNLHYMRYDHNYTLFAFIRDCNMLRTQHTFLDNIMFDVEEFLNFIIEQHVYESDEEYSSGSDFGGDHPISDDDSD